MTDWVILGTGESLKQEDVDFVKGKARVVAVSNSYTMAPWADILVSYDSAWWRENSEALKFKGMKISKNGYAGTELFNVDGMMRSCNSGMMAMFVAQYLGATRILLLGIDMHGTHFFGKHPPTLKNSDPIRFAYHMSQFNSWNGCKVINCNPNSSLVKFPFGDIRDLLNGCKREN